MWRALCYSPCFIAHLELSMGDLMRYFLYGFYHFQHNK